MPERTVISAVLFIFLLSVTISIIELFIPLSVKYDMNSYCRAALIKMESQGGMTDENRANLTNSLATRGLINISIYGTAEAKQGDTITLKVDADYIYSRLVILARSEITQHMVYNKSSVERLVLN